MAGAAAMELALPPWSRTAAMELALPPWNRTAAMELALPPWSRAAAMELALPPCSPRRRRAVRRARSRDIGEKGATDPSAIWRPFPIVIVSRLLSL